MKLAIFPNTEGTISVLVPAPNSGLTLEQVCAKDIPTGVPFRYLDTEVTPLPDREFRNAWTANFDNPDGYGA